MSYAIPSEIPQNNNEEIPISINNFDPSSQTGNILSSPRSLQACFNLGIEQKELIYKSKDEIFNEMPNSMRIKYKEDGNLIDFVYAKYDLLEAKRQQNVEKIKEERERIITEANEKEHQKQRKRGFSHYDSKEMIDSILFENNSMLEGQKDDFEHKRYYHSKFLEKKYNDIIKQNDTDIMMIENRLKAENKIAQKEYNLEKMKNELKSKREHYQARAQRRNEINDLQMKQKINELMEKELRDLKRVEELIEKRMAKKINSNTIEAREQPLEIVNKEETTSIEKDSPTTALKKKEPFSRFSTAACMEDFEKMTIMDGIGSQMSNLEWINLKSKSEKDVRKKVESVRKVVKAQMNRDHMDKELFERQQTDFFLLREKLRQADENREFVINNKIKCVSLESKKLERAKNNLEEIDQALNRKKKEQLENRLKSIYNSRENKKIMMREVKKVLIGSQLKSEMAQKSFERNKKLIEKNKFIYQVKLSYDNERSDAFMNLKKTLNFDKRRFYSSLQMEKLNMQNHLNNMTVNHRREIYDKGIFHPL